MSAFADVGQVLQTYFDALYHCDVAKLEAVFHPKAVYATADETPLLHRTMDEYCPVVARARIARVAQRAAPRCDRRHRVRR